MKLGVHVSIAGGLSLAVERAVRLGCTTMQIFSRSPRGGAAPVIAPAAARAFDVARRQAGIDPLAIHAPHIINLASPQPPMWQAALRLYQEEYARATLLQAQYLVTHVGSPKNDDPAAGIARVAQAIEQTLASQEHSDVMILLENTAGSGQGLGSRFEELAGIRAQVGAQARVGICLDTAHLFAAGYPIHEAAGLEETLGQFDRHVGFAQLRLIHLNDSKVPFDARVDRHWHIGEGHIGRAGFQRLLAHPRLRELPFILETPKTSDAEDLKNLSVVRQLAQALTCA
jgi:deoxyribonuclease-4